MILNGQDVTKEIRLPQISMYASAVSAHPGVRTFLLEMQRQLARTYNVIMDGRDIGTVILPNAQVKFFVTVSDRERARRRYHELIAKGETITEEEVYETMKARDLQDSTRAVAPAIPAEDAVFLDNSGDFDAVIETALRIIRGKTTK
jgi:cytidylate kinase